MKIKPGIFICISVLSLSSMGLSVCRLLVIITYCLSFCLGGSVAETGSGLGVCSLGSGNLTILDPT